MKGIISDFDGVLVETESAKAAGWYAAVLQLKGILTPEQVAQIVALGSEGRTLAAQLADAMRRTDQTSRSQTHLPKTEEERTRLRGAKLRSLPDERVRGLHEKSDFDLALWCAGGKTEDFQNNVWDVFVANDPAFRDRPSDELDALYGELGRFRNVLREPFIVLLAMPIPGNQRFFGRVFDEFKDAEQTPVVLVNQSSSEKMKSLFDEARLWTAEPRIPAAFGDHEPGFGFLRSINVGDVVPGSKPDKSGKRPTVVPDKTAAYLIACKVLGEPPARTLTIEDTDDGLDHADRAGIGLLLGFALPGSPHSYAKAHYVVEDSLEKVLPALRGLKDLSIIEVRSRLDDLAAQGLIRVPARRSEASTGSVFRGKTRIDWTQATDGTARKQYGRDWFDEMGVSDDVFRGDRTTLSRGRDGVWHGAVEEDGDSGYGEPQARAPGPCDWDLIRELEKTGRIAGDRGKSH